MPSVEDQRNLQLVRDVDGARARPGAVAIGNFDGLHRGHQQVIAVMREAAAAQGLVPSVLTFEPHPRRLFQPDAPQFRLERLGMKLRRLRDAGVAQVFMPRFDRRFAAMGAQQFLDDILGEKLQARAIVTGENFAFGQGRAGDVAMLRDWGVRHGVAVHTVPPVTVAGVVCSSSAVRQALAEGDVAQARALLGHDYQLRGRVVHGDGRGRTLGFATANIALPPGLKLPRNGIYAVRGEVETPLGKRCHAGAASLGMRPTVGVQDKPSLEVHLLDFAGDIYGARMTVSFVAWLRAEEKFPSLDAMVGQMTRDCAAAREALQGRA